MVNICVNKLGFLPARCQTNFWTNAELFPIDQVSVDS